MRRKGIETVFQRGEVIDQAGNPGAGDLAQIAHPGGKVRALHGQRIVRPQRGQHLGKVRPPGQPAVIVEGGEKAIRRADARDAGGAQKPACGVRWPDEQFTCPVPDVGRGGRRQRGADVKVAGEFDRAPGMERVADQTRQRRRPGVEFLLVGCVARDHPLRHTELAQGAVFVGVGCDPELRQCGEDPVVRQIPRAEVRVKVDDRQVRRLLVVELPRKGRAQEGVLVGGEVHDGEAGEEEGSRSTRPRTKINTAQATRAVVPTAQKTDP